MALRFDTNRLFGCGKHILCYPRPGRVLRPAGSVVMGTLVRCRERFGCGWRIHAPSSPAGPPARRRVTLPDITYSYTYRYGSRPHAVVSTGVFTYTYDADGNMITAKSDTLDRRLTWDEEDRFIVTKKN